MTWKDLLSRSYVPYSEKPWACIVVGKSGSGYPGVRIESNSFPLTMYAEQGALGFCYQQGDEPLEIIYQEKSMDAEFWKNELSIAISERNDISNIRIASPFYKPSRSISDELHDLLSKAKAPESNFQVSCLIETPQGYVAGVNVEFSDWQKGLCAERVAISICLASGESELQAIHVHASAGEFISPCGGCRQVIAEHIPHQRIGLYHPNNTVSEYFTSDMLPYQFTTLNVSRS